MTNRCNCGQDEDTHDKYRCKNEDGVFVLDQVCSECGHWITSHDENLGCHTKLFEYPNTIEEIDLNIDYMCPCSKTGFELGKIKEIETPL